MIYIGIDLGTSSVKLLAMNENGEVLKVVNKEYLIYFPHSGWSEQNPLDWYDKTIEGLEELLSNIDKSKVASIGVAGQMHGLVILDENDNVIRNAILWNDGRTAKQTKYLNEKIGVENLSKYTANIAFAGFTAPKILWVKENEPENFDKIRKIMLPKDYITYKLTGVFSTDYSDASGTLLLDVKNKKWSDEMIDICQIKKEYLPKLYESYDIVSNLDKNLAKKIGLSNDVKIIAGTGDNAGAAIGTATIGNGSCNISLGTSGTIFISNDSFCVDSQNALHSFDHSNGKYHLLACMLSAASCNKWWLEDILKSDNYNDEQKNINKLGENNVFYLPYLMGERSPHNDSDIRSTFIGMSMDTTREDMTQAVLEGVVFALRDSLEIARSLGIEIKKTKICGGGAKSLLWKQMIANILNVEVEVIENEEGPSYGVAILGAVACGEFDNIENATNELVNVVDVVKPDVELVLKYQEKYEFFKKIYPSIKDLFKK